MMVEIDGLSYWHIKKAIDDGLMPTLQAMMEEDGYRAVVDTTAACRP